jgi:hypothetical protein
MLNNVLTDAAALLKKRTLTPAEVGLATAISHTLEDAMRPNARFTEVNDHEGETWHFYLDAKGQEATLARFRELLEEMAARVVVSEEEEEGFSEFPFSLSLDLVPEYAVEVLINNGRSGYMPEHQRVSGYLDIKRLEKAIKKAKTAEELVNLFYKGRLEEFVK